MLDVLASDEYAIGRRRVLQAAGGSALLALIASCGSSSKGSAPQSTGTPNAAPSPRVGGTLTYVGNLQIQTMDPIYSAVVSERHVYYALYNTLVAYDTEFNLVPELAQSWSSDGANLVLDLQPDVKFHDGTDCDAEAVKFNLDRILDTASNSPLRGQLTPPLNGVDVISKTQVRLSLDTPWRPLLSALGERAGFIVSPTAVRKYGSDFERRPVGSGPYMLDEWEPGQDIVLKKFDGYWRKDEAFLDSIVLKTVQDAPVQLTMLRSGEAQLVDSVTPRLAATLQSESSVKTMSRGGGAWSAVQMNTTVAPFDNPKVRQALASATDAESVKKVVYLDGASLASQPVEVGWARNESLKYPYPFDLSAATEKLQGTSAGTVPMTLATSNTGDMQTMAEILFNGYSDLDLQVTAKTVPAQSWYASVQSGEITWTITTWTPRADPDGLLRILFHSEGAQNTTHFNDPDVDRLLDEAAVILDPEKAAPKYFEIAERIVEAAPYAFVVAPDSNVASAANLWGLKIYPDGILRFRDLYFA